MWIEREKQRVGLFFISLSIHQIGALYNSHWKYREFAEMLKCLHDAKIREEKKRKKESENI